MDGDAAPAGAAATGWVDPSKAVVARSNAALYKEVAGAGWLAVQDNGYFGAGLVEVLGGGGAFFSYRWNRRCSKAPTHKTQNTVAHAASSASRTQNTFSTRSSGRPQVHNATHLHFSYVRTTSGEVFDEVWVVKNKRA
jgi:hypothetical protein